MHSQTNFYGLIWPFLAFELDRLVEFCSIFVIFIQFWSIWNLIWPFPVKIGFVFMISMHSKTNFINFWELFALKFVQFCYVHWILFNLGDFHQMAINLKPIFTIFSQNWLGFYDFDAFNYQFYEFLDDFCLEIGLFLPCSLNLAQVFVIFIQFRSIWSLFLPFSVKIGLVFMISMHSMTNFMNFWEL